MSNKNKKIHFLIVEDEFEIGELIALFLASQFNSEFSFAHSGNEAIEVFKKNPQNFDFIISDFNMSPGTGWTLYQFVQDHRPEIPFLLVTSDNWEDHPEFHNKKNVGYLQKPFIDETIMSKVNTMLTQFQIIYSGSCEQSFVPVSVQTCARIKTISFPLFLRINDDKFLKMVHPGTVFDSLTLDRFKQKMIKELYVEKSNFDAFIKNFKQKVINEMVFTQAENSPLDSFNLSIAVQEIMLGAFKTFGWSDTTREMAEKNLSIVKNIINHHQELQSLLNWVENYDYDYSMVHSVLLCYIFTSISQDYSFKNTHGLKMLSLASFFHDVALTSHQVKNESRFIKASLLGTSINKTDIDQILIHPILAAEKIMTWRTCPEELMEIIINHHERPDGSGFPRQLKYDEIEELSACFIVAEDFVTQYLELKDKKQIFDYLHSAKKIFAMDPFLKFFKIIEKQLHKSVETNTSKDKKVS